MTQQQPLGVAPHPDPLPASAGRGERGAETEAAARAAIVAAARSWIGTPYHNCADIKGVGVDCGMLLVRIFVDTGLCPPFDPRPYSPDWHLHRDGERYLDFLFKRCAEVEKPQAGDVMMFHFGRCYSHGGVVTSAAPPITPNGAPRVFIVHAYRQTQCVIEEAVGGNGLLADPDRKPRFFSLWR